MNEIVLKLNKKDLEVVRKHLVQGLSYGVGGSFGDGENLYKADIKRANVAVRKIEEALGWWKK